MRNTILAGMLCLATAQMATAADAPPQIASMTRPQLAAAVREELLASWQAYEKYAWGHDELRPLSKTPRDWYGQSLLMTPVDSLDTLILLGFPAEADKARKLIVENLSFDKDITVKNFEITIRLLGGLLSAYQLTGDERLLRLADDLGTRLLPVFNSPTGMPYVYVNLKTGKTSGTKSNPAEIGTLLLEFGTLSRLTHKPVYYEKAKNAVVQLYRRRSKADLVGDEIDVESGQWTSRATHVGGGIDSYYEYLLKSARLLGDRECAAMWRTSIRAVNRHLADEAPSGFWYGEGDMQSGKLTKPDFGALQAFFPAVLALGGDVRRACQAGGVLPEDVAARRHRAGGARLPHDDHRRRSLSAAAGDRGIGLLPAPLHRRQRYIEMGRTFFESLVAHCRTDAGYTTLQSVVTKEKGDLMPSYFLAETLKYLYLLFAPDDALDFDHVTFNTEAHPLRAVALGK